MCASSCTCARVRVCACDYHIDIHVRPPTLLILAARENRVNDIPTVLYAYILWWCVLYLCIVMHTRIHEYYTFIYVRAETRYPSGTSFFARSDARAHTHTLDCIYIYIYILLTVPKTVRCTHCS